MSTIPCWTRRDLAKSIPRNECHPPRRELQSENKEKTQTLIRLQVSSCPVNGLCCSSEVNSDDIVPVRKFGFEYLRLSALEASSHYRVSRSLDHFKYFKRQLLSRSSNQACRFATQPNKQVIYTV